MPLLAPCALLAAIGAVAVRPPMAHAAVGTPLRGMFSITPARTYDVGRPPAVLTPTTVSNTTAGALRVTAIPVLLRQQRSGAFAFTSPTGQLRSGRRFLSAMPDRFDLPPGASMSVSLTWRGVPAHRRGVSVGVIYAAVPSTSTGPVTVVERLLGVDILSLPGHRSETGALTAVHVTRAPNGMPRLALAVRNTGDGALTPASLSLTVRDARHAKVWHRRLRPDVVLPHATREFALDMKRRLPRGEYSVTASGRLGDGEPVSVSASFDVARSGELPAAHLDVGAIEASGDVGGAADVSAKVRNAGTAPGSESIELRLYRLLGGVPGRTPVASRTLRSGALAAGAGKDLHAGLGRLQAGTYRLLATYEDAASRRQTTIADFEALPPVGVIERLTQLSREHPLLIPGLLALAVLALVLAVLALGGALLRGRRREARPLAAARREIATLDGGWSGQGTS